MKNSLSHIIDLTSHESSLQTTKTLASTEIDFSGTLYNKERLQEKLSTTSTEDDAILLLQAYDTWGIDMLHHLEGIFAFVLLDKKKEILYLVKDKVSIKPLYYTKQEKFFCVNSSLKELVKMPHVPKELNRQALANYFTYGYIMQPNTIYQECYKVKSGHYLTLDITTKQITQTSYWDLGEAYDQPKLSWSEKEFENKAHQLLTNSVTKRISKAGNFGASLSGGYDSSTIAAILQEQAPHKIKTFTIGFEDESINEAPEAKKIAQHLQTEHIEHYFSDQDAMHIIPMLSEVYEEPFYDNGSIPTTLLSSIAKEHGIDTIFAGDGGDEVFATADDIERFERILAIPQDIRHRLFSLANLLNPSTLPYLKDSKNIPTKYYKLLHIFKAQSIPEMVKIKMTLFHPFEIKKLLQHNDITYPSTFDDIYFGKHAQSVDKVIGSYFKSFMTDGELIKTTQAFGYHDIQIREPYLDRELIALMAQVPSEIKIKDGIKKHLLKNIAHHYIPKSLLDRPKKGFSVPFSRWMKGELKPLLMETLNESNLKKDGILDVSYVINIRNQFLAGKEEYKYKLWSILLYQLWYQKNMRK